MKTLKEFLKETLVAEKDSLMKKASSRSDELRSIENAQKYTYFFEQNWGKYLVSIVSDFSEEGETNTVTEYMGKLQDAVKSAKREFTETNNRLDVCGKITVKVNLVGREYIIPRKYWED